MFSILLNVHTFTCTWKENLDTFNKTWSNIAAIYLMIAEIMNVMNDNLKDIAIGQKT